ncbi:DUF4435 domain-containing protein [Mucilaginibacter sp.]|uniref:DUF4435 domain-containing protein n=1 Tax=Mucilaginibacter sp. TaxID=1882438 RepID=UPI0025EE64CC|nr:DUF4435 domain-containing protein [Mucilaginibacter sp.]
MNEKTENFIEFVEKAKDEYLVTRKIAIDAKSDEKLLDFYDEINYFLKCLIDTVAKEDYKINYLNQFREDIQLSFNYLPYRGQPSNDFVFGNERHIVQELYNHKRELEEIFKALNFKLEFFKKLNFFNNNVVVVGANGSGKTSISNKFKEFMADNGVVISAQRILLVPTFNSVNNYSNTLNDLKAVQVRDKSNKNHENIAALQTEFEILLKNLISENNLLSNNYRIEAQELALKGEQIPPPSKSNLDKTIDIWNSLISHRKIECKDGMNIMVALDNGSRYPSVQMSDGEKVMLFLIAQVLQAPRDGFVIVDEPEMYLHKTILNKLWDSLENQRGDCIFIYLTHDLDFATSRITAKKIWIKSYFFPDKWDMEVIPENELPESLLMELLGSRKNVLFCEGEKGKIDEKVYNILFPNYTITPVGGCFEVISHTKAFNKIPNTNIKAIGLIDSDHHPTERLSKLRLNSVYHFSVAEVENLLLDEDFLKKLASNLMVNSEAIDSIKKDILKDLNAKKEIQAANFVSSRMDYYFKDSNVIKGNSLENLEANFSKFTGEMKIKESYEKRVEELSNIVKSNNYKMAICVYNNKSINIYVERHFKITDFTDRAIKLLQFDGTTHRLLLKYFPSELTA